MRFAVIASTRSVCPRCIGPPFMAEPCRSAHRSTLCHPAIGAQTGSRQAEGGCTADSGQTNPAAVYSRVHVSRIAEADCSYKRDSQLVLQLLSHLCAPRSPIHAAVFSFSAARSPSAPPVVLLLLDRG